MKKEMITKQINEYQANKYTLAEQRAIEHYLDIYKELLGEMISKKNVSILDVGETVRKPEMM